MPENGRIEYRNIYKQMSGDKYMKHMLKITAVMVSACLLLAGTYIQPVSVLAANTTTTDVLEMKASTDKPNLNPGQSFDVTISAKSAASGFTCRLDYDTSVFQAVTIVTGKEGSTSNTTDNTGEWKAVYDGSSKMLSAYYYLKDSNGKVTSQIGSPAQQSGGNTLVTLKFTSSKAVLRTDIRMDFASVLLTDGTTQSQGTQKLSLINSQAKEVTLSPGIFKGNGRISVPVHFAKNDGFTKLKLGISFNNNVLEFESISLEADVQKSLTQGATNMASSGGYVTAEFTANENLNTTGDLMYVNFKMLNSSSGYGYYPTINTSVTIAVVDVTNQAEDIFSYNSVTTDVTVSDAAHTLGDVSGDGKINLIDAVYAIQYYNGTKTLTASEKTAADVNKDGTVNLTDALMIIQYYNGKITTF